MYGKLLTQPDFGAQSMHSGRGDGVWHVLQTRVRYEKALSLELSAIGLKNVLPVTFQERYFGRRRAVVELPVFPGLVFLEGCEADLELACQTMRVLQTIKVADPESMKWTLGNLKTLSQRPVEITACARLVCGRRVEVTSGLLCGLQGLVDDSCDRLVFQVDGSLAAAGVKLSGQTLASVA